MSRERYTTKQSKIVLDAIRKKKSNFSIAELEEELKDQAGSATIYRQIKKLIEDGEVKKQDANDESSYYYVGSCKNDEHFYLLCEECGKLKHEDCECLTDFYQKILGEHNFEINHKNLIIPGKCQKCKEKEK